VRNCEIKLLPDEMEIGAWQIHEGTPIAETVN
jgi:hypothetical protein